MKIILTKFRNDWVKIIILLKLKMAYFRANASFAQPLGAILTGHTTYKFLVFMTIYVINTSSFYTSPLIRNPRLINCTIIPWPCTCASFKYFSKIVPITFKYDFGNIWCDIYGVAFGEKAGEVCTLYSILGPFIGNLSISSI